MKTVIISLFTILAINLTTNLYGQSDSLMQDSSAASQPVFLDDSLPTTAKFKTSRSARARNIIKINLAPLLFKTYSLQYERVLSRKISVAVQYRTMPETGLPFKSNILTLIGDDDPETKKIIDDFKMSNYAITPEIRIYLSKKGYGRGLYFAPFYRYTSFTSSDFNVFYTDDANLEQSIKMTGKLTSNTFGFLLGVQNALGKRVVLDWTILGPHFGSAKGHFSGNKALSAAEQVDLRQTLEDIEIPLTNKTVNVNANSAALNIDGPWAGFRFTFAIGVRL